MHNKQIKESLKGKTGKDILNLVDPDSEKIKKLTFPNPEKEIESELFFFWENLLGHSGFGDNDDFFKNGGNSIKAIQLLSRISTRFLVQLVASDVFLHPTISQLADLIRIRKNGHTVHPISSQIKKQERPSFIPLSFSQERLLFIDRLDGSIQYHIPAVISLKGNLNKNALEHAFRQIVNRHEVLRTVFLINEEKIFQHIKATDEWSLGIVNGSDFKEDREGLRNFVKKLVNVPFDLSRDNMLRADLITLEKGDFVLVVTMHHIASDGWSVSILINEVIELYNSYVENRASDLPRLNIQYSDYAIWQRRHMRGELLDKKLGYWKEKLKGSSVLNLPEDYSRPAVQSIRGSVFEFHVENEIRYSLNLLSQKYGVTLFMTLLTSFNILLYRYSGQHDISIGIPAAGRQYHHLEGLIGFFINTLVLRSEVNGKMSFRDFLQQVRANTLEALEHQDVPFEKVVEAVVKERDQSRSPLFQCAFVFQNTPEAGELQMRDVELFFESAEQDTAKFELTFSFKETSEGLQGSVEYCTDLYNPDTIERMTEHYKELLRSIVISPEENIDSLSMMTGSEAQRLLSDSGDVSAGYPLNKSIINLFEEQAAKTPDGIAIVFEDQMITYRELNERSNRLAHYLKSKGVKAETPVPICMERSIDMIAGILGILKAGVAYVPVDPDYPQDRINYILEDTGASIAVCSKESSLKFQDSGKIYIVETNGDRTNINKQPSENPEQSAEPHNLAYVIYTSGSTGKPKGVMVSHSNVVRLFKNDSPLFDFNEKDVWTMYHSFCFDFSVWEMFGALLFGGRLVIVPKDITKDASLFSRLLLSENVTVLNQIPSAFYALQESLSENVIPFKIRYVIFGGESLDPAKLKCWKRSYPECRLINMYGITETTVHVTYQEIGWQHIESGKSIIGKPIPTLSLHVLDKNQNLLPAGIAGELCIGGAGLARGYLNLPELTSEKFIKDPFSEKPEAKLYRSGDLGKRLQDGSIEYLGRIDDQVKIRGYRIELGEIENVLQQSDLVSRAVVTAREDRQGSRRLIGYVTAKGLFDKEKIISHLRGKLPEYMVPAIWVELENFPQTISGKPDRNALKDPDEDDLTSNEYARPRNKTEEDLITIWKELLGTERVGINDNFFELGGDSIQTIQAASRANRMGYSLRPKDFFNHQTIAGLSKAITDHDPQAYNVQTETGQLTGPCGLLPIQQRYFENCSTEVSHFNQSIFLDINKTVSPEIINSAIEQLTYHHDALRFEYHIKNGLWNQEYGTKKGNLITVDLRASKQEHLDSIIKMHSGNFQRSLDIEKGDLTKFVLILTPENQTYNRMLLVIHHLAVDGVTWRILLEDLSHLLNALMTKEKAAPVKKGSSYRQWYGTLQKYGRSKRLLSQQEYWRNVSKGYAPVKTDIEYSGEVKVKDLSDYSIILNAEQTKHLIRDVSSVYHTEVNDLLICALVMAISGLSTGERIIIGLEGHGRELPGDDINTSRTAGWFTSIFPVLLSLEDCKEKDSIIKSVKEQLRNIPDKGLGYGVLKYINREESLRGKDPWEIVFNYLGQLDNVVNENEFFKLANEPAGTDRNEEQTVSEKLSVNCFIQSGELTFNWVFSSLQYRQKTIETLAKNYISVLESLIDHCLKKHKSGEVYTPSDFGLSPEVSYSELDNFLDETVNGKPRRDLTEGIYCLSSLQSGMLFHSLFDERAGVYVEQFSCDVFNVDPENFKKSWNIILKNHSILRSVFYDDKFEIPVQCIFRDVELPVEFSDLRELNDIEQAAAIKKYEEKDRIKGFDFKTAPLMRAGLIRLSEDRYRIIWTFHHILFDGWSLQLLLEEFLNTYDNLASGIPLKTGSEDKYEDFISYLARRDNEEEDNYWLNYMKGFEGSTQLPFIRTASQRNKGPGEYKTISLNLNYLTSESVKSFARKYRITGNTVLQGVWAYLLHQYTGKRDIIYGVIVSGRPEDLPGIEQRVGIYINTLPLRSVLDEDQITAEWLQNLQHEQINSRKYQFTSLNDIRNMSGIREDLFDSILAFENYPVSKVISSRQWGLKAENVRMMEQTNFPLNITAVSQDLLNISFCYNSNLLDEVYIKMMRDHFESVLIQMVENGEQSLGEIKLLSKEEEHKLLVEFNDTSSDYPTDKNLIELFEEQSAKTPDAAALVFKQEKLTYEELDQRSNRLAQYLLDQGVCPGENIGLLSLRGIDMITGMFGILKAGCSYVPFNLGYPNERIKYIIEDSSIKHILSTDKEMVSSPGLSGYEHININDSLSCSAESTGIKVNIDSCACIMFTSGTTGRPKGIAISHRNILNLVFDRGEISVRPGDRVLQWSNYSFDGSTYDIYCSLLKGASLYLIKDEWASDASELTRIIKEENITVCFITTALFNTIIDIQPQAFKGLRKILFGGEIASVSYVRKALSVLGEGKIVHVYGPTETTVYSTSYPLNEIRSDNVIPIGKPLSNTRVFILNDYMHLTAQGVEGELYIGGDGVSLGYVNNEVLNQEKFISNPYSENKADKLYRTGDIVRWLPDGNIEFTGRKDDQVKLRGYRIEPGGIESVILQSGMVKETAVLLKEDREGNKRLAAYNVPGEDYDREKVVNYLRSKLPDFMIPVLFIEMEGLPLNSIGKIDRKALSETEVSELLRNQYTPSRNAIEEKLTVIWQNLLGLERIGIHDNFFELGGHSLLAMRVISSLRRELKSEISVRDIFLHPTIAELAAYLKSHDKGILLPGIELQTRSEKIPLSFSQERLWFIDRLEGSTQYHIPSVFQLKGKLNRDALVFSFQSIVNRHEVLRTVIKEDHGEGYQTIKDKDCWKLKISDGTAYKENPEELQSHIQQLITCPFDLSEDYMIRGNLIIINEDEHILVLTLHHIASDGWSLSVIVKELMEFYSSYEENREARLLPLPLQYADYSIWQRNYLQGEVVERKLDYWKEKLKETEPLQLPTDFERPPVQSIKGAAADFEIEKDLSDQLLELSLKNGATVFMTLLTAFKVLLHRHSRQQDICVGSPIAGRQQEETEGLIGFFVNTLAIRSKLTGEVTFSELLDQVRSTTLEAYENQEAPFEKVVEAVVKKRDISRSPLFQVMFALQNTPEVPELRYEDLNLLRKEFKYDISKFDLTFFMTGTSSGLKGSVEYCTDLFNEQTIRRMIGHFLELLRSITADPDNEIGLLQMLTKSEEQQLLKDFNDTKVDYPDYKSIADLFEEQALKTPDNIALVLEEQQLTYRELNERSNKLAHYLKGKGVKAGTLIPVCLNRSPEMITAVLGILKTGCAYVPVDPEYPLERINFILEDTEAALMLTGKDLRLKLQFKKGIEILEADYEQPAIYNQPVNNLTERAGPGSLAYVIYTSGTTGKPKGVRMSGSSLVNLLMWQEKQFVNKQRKVLQYTGLNFDVSFQEIFSTLCFGSTLYLISAERRIDMSEVIKDAAKYGITHLFIPYIVLKNLAEHISSGSGDAHSLEEIITAGEQLKITKDISALLKNNSICLINQYGPTEAHVVSSYRIDSNNISGLLPPIGRPIDNTQLYILSDKDQLVPAGVAGELCIGGVQVSSGYLNLPELTQEKFIKDSFSTESGSRLYRTGDLCRWMPDGNIEYLGRTDDQVKIRGYRVEPGEIESVLQQCDLVRQSAVIAQDSKEAGKRLAAYIVTEGVFKKEEIISYLRSKLPEYMIPVLWADLESLPLTPNGKIDKKALPDPDTESISDQYAAPRNESEEKLISIWKRLLETEHVGIKDNFFELGGHSLLAMRVISAIRKELGLELAIRDIFLNPTIAELSQYLESQSTGILLPEIIAGQRPERIPLSFSQERLWFIDRFEGSVQYHLPAVLRLKGKLNADALEFALQSIINRHEILRTVIREEEGIGYQVIKDADNWKLEIIDGTHYKGKQDELQNHLEQLINAPIDLSEDHMLRAHLIKISKDEHLLALTLHHIASDGWSFSILVNELGELYAAGEENREAKLLQLPLQYADFAIWQRNYMQGDIPEKMLRYWEEKLKDTEPLQLPADHSRPAVQSIKGAAAEFRIDKELSDQLQLLSNKLGATLFMTLLAAFKVLLHRYSGQQDICVGTPISGRRLEETEHLIGFFVNTLALRSKVNSDESFTEFLKQVKATTLDAYEHQDVPFEKVVGAVVKQRDMSRSPLFQVSFVLQNTPEIPELHPGKLDISAEEFQNNISKFDLTFNIKQTASGLQGSIVYCTKLFNKETISRTTDHFRNLIISIVNNPQQKIGLLPILTNAEEHQLIFDFNDTAAEYPSDKSLVDLFEEQVTRTPGAEAVKFEQKILTYKELNELSNRLAHYLKNIGVIEETPVPICIERSPEMIIGILGILKAGGAYVPIDPGYPPDRMRYILEDTKSLYIVCSRKSAEKLPISGKLTVIALDEDLLSNSSLSADNLSACITPVNLAYTIYTSGSTGKPKGVMVEHRAVVNFINNQSKFFGISSDERILQFSNYCFDASVEQIFLALLNGASLIMFPEGKQLNLKDFNEFLIRERITHLHATPNFLENLNADNDQSLKRVISGGDVCRKELSDKWKDKVSFYNKYGPTETTITSAEYHVCGNTIENERYIPIGKPINNTKIYILGAHNEPVPIGIPGEICIGGDGLARGYLNSVELTEEKFITDPFNSGGQKKIYKTGDTGKWLPDGNIKFLGRKDDQIKIRGYRVEPAEIENVLLQSSLVNNAVVLAREDKKGNKRLIGYVLPNGSFNKKDIITYLGTKLPEYMVPSVWVELESLPQTSGGKTDRNSLPDPDTSEMTGNEYEAPSNELEVALAGIWQDLLDVKRVGINDNFFELGGHSLLALRLFSHIEKLTGKNLAISTLFNSPTIKGLSKIIRDEGWTPVWKSLIPVKPDGSRLPLFCVPPASGTALHFQQLLKYLHSEQPMYVLEPVGLDGKEPPHTDFKEMAAFYVKEIRLLQPTGPYLLGGRCLGGRVVFEMAQQLTAAGQKVALLAVFDTWPPFIAIPPAHVPQKRDMEHFIIRSYHHLKTGDMLTVVKNYSTALFTKTYRQIKNKIKYVFSNSGKRVFEEIRQIHFKAQDRYVASKYPGKITLIECSTFNLKNREGWKNLAGGGFETYLIPGTNHKTIMAEPHIRLFAETLNRVLDKTNDEIESELNSGFQ